MASSSIWMVSDDTAAIEGLGQWFEAQMGASLVGFACERWNECATQTPAPRWLLVDLRSEQSWQRFQSTFDRLRKLPGQVTPLVGLVGEGIPLEHLAWADAVFSALVPFPTRPDSKFSNALHEAASLEHRRVLSNDLGEQRLLEGTTGRFLTSTPELFAVVEQLEVAARHDFTILLIGETGTGKTTLARLIHELSPRRDERFLPVACGALPGDLIDSDLFGHVKGAFTGADRTKPGKFDAADNGTILLDEIDVLAPLQQAKLLRVIETGEFEPVGSNETHKVNTRTIVASNLCLEGLMARNAFRADLYFRLNEVKFEIPPLRNRPRDIVPITVDIIEQCCRENRLNVTHVDPRLIDVLKVYSWPGNIRELRNEVRRAVLFSREGKVTSSAFSPPVLKEAERALEQSQQSHLLPGLANVVGNTEQELIEQMLHTQNFNRAATARALGISRVTLYNKMRKYQIDPGETPEEPK